MAMVDFQRTILNPKTGNITFHSRPILTEGPKGEFSIADLYLGIFNRTSPDGSPYITVELGHHIHSASAIKHALQIIQGKCSIPNYTDQCPAMDHFDCMLNANGVSRPYEWMQLNKLQFHTPAMADSYSLVWEANHHDNDSEKCTE
jgi:hypothetical protein